MTLRCHATADSRQNQLCEGLCLRYTEVSWESQKAHVLFCVSNCSVVSTLVQVSPLSPVAPQSPKSKEAATDIATGKSESAPAKIPSESKGAPSPKTGRGLSRRIARSLKRNKSGKGTSLKKKSFLGRGKRTAVGNADVVIATDSTGTRMFCLTPSHTLCYGYGVRNCVSIKAVPLRHNRCVGVDTEFCFVCKFAMLTFAVVDTKVHQMIDLSA